MPPLPFALIAGAGPGTGSAIARKFAASYPVVLMARTAANLEALVTEINGSGGKAVGISTDIADSASVKNAMTQVEKEFPGAACAAAVFNASAGFTRKPFLETTEEDMYSNYRINVVGAYNFSQAALPLLLKAVDDSSSKHPPTLIFTGATASLKSGAMFSAFSASKFALRAVAQSLGREFGPKGVHVVHAVIDGLIDTEGTKDYMKDAGPDAKISPDAIAASYWNLHTQHRSCFTGEIDLRPYLEKW